MGSTRSHKHYKELKTLLKKWRWSIDERDIKQDIVLVEREGCSYALLFFYGNEPLHDWLADEEDFNGEKPLWFSESSHCISPVYKVKEYVDSLPAEEKRYEPIVVLMDGSTIINAYDMIEVWQEMGVVVASCTRVMGVVELGDNLAISTLKFDINKVPATFKPVVKRDKKSVKGSNPTTTEEVND